MRKIRTTVPDQFDEILQEPTAWQIWRLERDALYEFQHVDPAADKAAVTAFLKGLVPAPPRSTPWQDTIDCWLEATVEFFRRRSATAKRRGRRSVAPGKEWFRLAVGFLGTGEVERQERRKDGRVVSRREASRRLARYIMTSPILLRLTADERALLNIPPADVKRDGAGAVRAQVTAFAGRLRDGDK
jgi:hypothetical protein